MFTKRFLAVLAAFIITTIAFAQNFSTAVDQAGKWKLGLNMGMAWQKADVKSRLGQGIGITLERSIIENSRSAFGLSVRGRYLYSHTWGKDYKPSTGIFNNPVLNGTNNSSLDYASSPGFAYMNYFTKIDELTLEGIIFLNRLRHHGILLYGFGGIGATGFRSYYDQMDLSGNPYNYASISGTTKHEVYRELDQMRDKNYETPAENNGRPQWVYAPSFGGGIGFYTGPRTVLGFEHKVTFPRTDLLDGQRWDNNNNAAGINDIYHYTNFYIRLSLFGKIERTPRTRTRIEPNTYTYSPATPKPEIYVNHPTVNPYNAYNCTADIFLTIRNVNNRVGVSVLMDGSIVSPTQYDFNPGTGLFTLKMALTKNSTFAITAENAGGKTTKYITFNCVNQNIQPQQPAPIVTITMPNTTPYNDPDCGANVMATIENIADKGNLEVRVNGLIISSSLYDYNPASKIFTLNTPIDGSATIIILAANSVGSAAESVVINCVRYTPPPVLLRPVITINKPVPNPSTSKDCIADIQARVENIENENSIEVRQNGNIISSTLYSYNTQSKIFYLNTPIQGITTFVITAVNAAGKESVSLTIKCEPAPIIPSNPKPVIQVTKPVNNPHITPDCNAGVSALIYNIASQANIEVRLNGAIISSSLYSYDPRTNVFFLNTPITEVTSFTIIASNSAGKASEVVTIKCEPKQEEKPVIPPPVINVSRPTDNPHIAADCKAGITATILNVDGKQNIEVRENGLIISSVLYSYDPFTKIFNLNADLKQITTYTITAVNTAGRASTNITVKCEPKYEEPVLPKPVLTVINPGENPYVSPNCKLGLNALILNVSGKENIEVRQNGQIINSSLYSYDVVTKMLILNTDIKEITTYTITAVNASGKASSDLTVKCEPKEEEKPAPKPVITVTKPTENPYITGECKATINATILNIEGKQNIEVRMNGAIISSSLYSYDINTRVFTLNANITEVAAYTIIASNANGKESATITLKCEPKQEDKPALPKPEITINTPGDNPHIAPDCKAGINATILNIDDKKNIEVRANGAIISSSLYSYDAASKVFTLNVDVKEIVSYTITAVNASGKASAVITIKCEPKEEEKPVVPKPVINIENPTENPYIAPDCKAGIKASILNIESKTNIEVRANGAVISSSLYSYDAASKVFTLNAEVKEVITYTITAVNASGKESISLTIKCEPKEEDKPALPKPVIIVNTPTENPYTDPNCKANINTTIKNIESKANIEVRQNGQVISSSLYSYDAANKVFTLNADVKEIVSYTITAVNASGKETVTITIKCEPKVEEKPVLPKPVITVNTPIYNPHIAPDCKATIKATIENIEGKANIEVRQNGQVLSGSLYTFDATSKVFTLNADVKEVSTYTIAAVNASGKESVTLTIKCEPKQPEPTPEETTDNCGCTSAPVVASADLYLNATVVTSSEISVNAGSKMLIKPGQNFSGNVNMNGGTLIIGGSAEVNNINFNAGDIVILGSANFKNINANNSSSDIKNYGILNASNITFNGTFENHGTAGITVDLNVNSSATLNNTGVLNVSGSLNNNNVTNNTGVINVSNNLKNNGSASFTNKCQINVSNEFHNNNSFINNGRIAVSAYTYVNAGKLVMNGGSKIITGNLIVNATIAGEIANCASIKVNNKTTLNSGASITGKVEVCDENGIETNILNIISACNCQAKACTNPSIPRPVIPMYNEPTPTEEEKVSICHLPPGNPDNPQTILIPKSALKAHLDHGDVIGTCDEVEKKKRDDEEKKRVEDEKKKKAEEEKKKKAEEEKKRLEEEKKVIDTPTEEEKVTICHLPPGNPDNTQTIVIPKSALKAHLDHGDKIGECPKIEPKPEKKNNFDIDKGTVVPKECFNATVTVLGCALKEGGVGIDYPVMVQVKFGNNTIDPFGTYSGYNKASNVNDQKQHTWKSPQPLAANTAISVKTKSFNPKTGTLLYERNSANNDAFVRVLRNGDAVPQITGFAGQADVESYLQGYFVNGKVTLEANQAIYLFELGTNNTTSKSYDMQDCVVLVTIDPAECPKTPEEDKKVIDTPTEEEKVTICHIPPGNPTNANTLSV
ncbi:MAG: hypothetical protein K2X86_15200, partial [Cytophagaceae bacterium]|nr:hypothetical protein [Cytophagaceae bacterium]